MKNKRNLWIIHPYATDSNRSGLTRAHDFAKELVGKGYEVTIFTSSYLHYSDKQVDTFGKKYFIERNDNFISTIYLKTPNGNGNGLKRILNMVFFYINFCKNVKNMYTVLGKPSVVIASTPHLLSPLAGIFLKEKLHIPLITEVRDFWPEVFFLNGTINKNGLLGKILLKYEKWVYMQSDAIIFLKPNDTSYLTDQNWLEEIELKKCFYINNGVNLEEFNFNIKNNNYFDKHLDDENLIKIVYTGAVRNVNDVSKLVRIAKNINIENVKLIIFGDGNELETLKLQANNCNNIIFKGRIEKKFIPSILSKATYNLLHYSETNYNWSRGNSSNKLFEYFASGKPVISTIDFSHNLITINNCGFVAANQSDLDLAHLFENLPDKHSEIYQKMCKNSLTTSQDFSFDALSNELNKCVDYVLEERKTI